MAADAEPDQDGLRLAAPGQGAGQHGRIIRQACEHAGLRSHQGVGLLIARDKGPRSRARGCSDQCSTSNSRGARRGPPRPCRPFRPGAIASPDEHWRVVSWRDAGLPPRRSIPRRPMASRDHPQSRHDKKRGRSTQRRRKSFFPSRPNACRHGPFPIGVTFPGGRPRGIVVCVRMASRGAALQRAPPRKYSASRRR